MMKKVFLLFLSVIGCCFFTFLYMFGQQGILSSQSPDGQLLARTKWSDSGKRITLSIQNSQSSEAKQVLQHSGYCELVAAEECPQEILWDRNSKHFLYVTAWEVAGNQYKAFVVNRSPLRCVESDPKSAWVKPLLRWHASQGEGKAREIAAGFLD